MEPVPPHKVWASGLVSQSLSYHNTPPGSEPKLEPPGEFFFSEREARPPKRQFLKPSLGFPPLVEEPKTSTTLTPHFGGFAQDLFGPLPYEPFKRCPTCSPLKGG